MAAVDDDGVDDELVDVELVAVGRGAADCR